MKVLSIIVPVYNEEKTVAKVIEEIAKIDLSQIWYTKEMILVNDGSRDKSEETIMPYLQKTYNDMTVRYEKHEKNKGKWAALKTWFALATGDVYLIQDADMEYDPNDYIPLLQHLEKSWCDMVYGSRIRGMRKFRNNYSTASFLLWWLTVSLMTSLLSRRWITDEPTCYKMYRWSLKPYLIYPEENGFEWEPAVTMLLLRTWHTYSEIPIHYTARKVTEGKKIKRKDGIKALTTLLTRKYKPLHIWKSQS